MGNGQQKNPYWAQSVKDVLHYFQTTPESGLSELEVKKRQKQYGLNDVTAQKKRHAAKYIKRQAWLCELDQVRNFSDQ